MIVEQIVDFFKYPPACSQLSDNIVLDSGGYLGLRGIWIRFRFKQFGLGHLFSSHETLFVWLSVGDINRPFGQLFRDPNQKFVV